MNRPNYLSAQSFRRSCIMNYLDQYQQKPIYNADRDGHLEDYWDDLASLETKIYVPIIGGPIFCSPWVKRRWTKKPRSLLALAARAVGQSFTGGVVKSIQYLQHFPCPQEVIKATHKYILMNENDWDIFVRVERFWPWFDYDGARIKRACRFYAKRYPYSEDLLKPISFKMERRTT